LSQNVVFTEPANIAAHLVAMAANEPYRRAVIAPAGRDHAGRACYTQLTYRGLDRDSDAIAVGLSAAGVERGARAVLMVRPGLDFFSLVFALFKAGIVPVVIDPGIGLKGLAHCCAQAAPDAFIGIPKAIAAQRIFAWGGRTVKQRIWVGPGVPSLGEKIKTLEYLRFVGKYELAKRPDRAPLVTPESIDETAAILFTSGSTGPPKGAVYSHAIFLSQIKAFRALYQIEGGEIDLCTFPLFALFAPALQMTAVIPEMDPTRPARVDPFKLFEAIEDFGVTNLFGSPALLRRLAEGAEASGIRLPTLKRIISAGAPVSAALLERLARLVDPPAQIFTPYGATESLPVASIGSDEILGETRAATERGMGVCVGAPVDGMEVDVISIDDQPIATWSDASPVSNGEIGEFVVSGPVVTREYFNRPESTALAKIRRGEGDVVLHRMGDVGYRDDKGRLWFCGRKSHRVIARGKTYFTIPCEAIFNTHAEVARTALVGAVVKGEVVPVVCVEPVRRLTRLDRRRVARELLERGALFAHTMNIRTFLFHPGFPVDARHNAKIFREKLAAWATRRLS
jgi:acyl-CoA synthetase (AMP-forming)/AMP-acid ligase II